MPVRPHRRARSGAGVRPTAAVRAALAVAGEPELWPVAVRQASRLAVPGWWRRPPYLPLPDPSYLRFRLQTMYGDGVVEPGRGDLLTWLRWCRQFDRLTTSDRPT